MSCDCNYKLHISLHDIHIVCVYHNTIVYVYDIYSCIRTLMGFFLIKKNSTVRLQSRFNGSGFVDTVTGQIHRENDSQIQQVIYQADDKDLLD